MTWAPIDPAPKPLKALLIDFWVAQPAADGSRFLDPCLDAAARGLVAGCRSSPRLRAASNARHTATAKAI